MIRHDDSVQIDRIIYHFKGFIKDLQVKNNKLNEVVKYLHIEMTRIQNKPIEEDSGELKKKSLVVKVSKAKINLDDPLVKWHTGHFLRYFQQKFEELYKIAFIIKDKNWRIYSIRIKQFRTAHKEILDNYAYKDFLDWVFKYKFNQKFIASIPLVSSAALLTQWNISLGPSSKVNWETFDELVKNLPKGNKDINDLLKEAF